MYSILLSFFSICLLRTRPQDLPAAPVLAVVALLMYVGAGLVMALQSMEYPGAFGLVAVDSALFGGLTYLLLWIRELPERFLQTFSALFGSSAILELCAVPLILWQQQGLGAETLTTGTVIASLLLWAWLFWSLIVIGHILRHAIGTVLPIGVLLGLLYMFISFSVTRSLFFSAAA